MDKMPSTAPVNEKADDADDIAALTICRRIVVIIPTFNEEACIEKCLTCLMDKTSVAQFIVMDGGSQDGTCAIVERLALSRPNLSLHHNPRRNQAAATNNGLNHADPTRDILIRCDAHAHYPEGYVTNVALRLIETGADSLTVPMDAAPAPDGGAFAKANAWAVDTLLGAGGSPHRGGRVSGFVDHGHHAGFWRARFEGLGGYNENIVPNEDAEYDTRLRADGGKVWLAADLRITYFPRASFKALWSQYFGYGVGRARHHISQKAPLAKRQIIPIAHIISLTLSAGLCPFTWVGWAYPLLYGSVLLAATIGAIVKHRSAAALLVPLALFGMHSSWGLGFLTGCFTFKKGSK
ncbi:MAG: glycosyltransferase family 2 protein [Pseudomonadota bacterium]